MKLKTRFGDLEVLFYIALFCEIFAMQLDLTALPYQMEWLYGFMKGLRCTGYVLVLTKLFKTRFTTGEFIRLIVIVSVMGIRVPVIGRAFFLVFLYIYGAKEIKFEKLARVMSVWFAAGVILTILGGCVGIIENWGYNLDSSRPRYALGYFYPSHVTSAILFTLLLICYVVKDKLKLWHVIILECFNYWQYTQTDSRTGTAMVAVVLVVFWSLRFLKKEAVKNVVCKLLSYSFLFSALVSLIGSIFYDASSGIWTSINAFCSNRLELAHNAIDTYGIKLWGQGIKWIGYGGLGHSYQKLEGAYNFVDCSYIKLLLDEGIVFFVVVIIGFTLACRRAAQNKDIYLCFALAFTAVYSIMEPRLCEIGFNPFMLVLVVLIDYRGRFLSRKVNMTI